MKKTLLLSCMLVSILVSLKPLFAGEAKGSFKEPVLVWEREFDPPLTEISAKNSAGEYLAVERRGGKGDESWDHTRLLFLGSNGQTVREIVLQKKEKRTIPAEQVWLTYYGKRWDSDEFKNSFKAGKKIETITSDAYISGDGEYYGIRIKDTARKGGDEYSSPWYEFSYYDKMGKLLWKYIPENNYGCKEIHVSYDGSLVLIIDGTDYDYSGQSWHLFNRDGKLIKKREYGANFGRWLKYVDISENGEYIVYTKEKKTGLMDRGGNVLWEKDFGSDQPRIHVSGMVLTLRYLLDITGRVILEDKGLMRFSPSGKYIVSLGKENNDNYRIFETVKGEEILELSPEDILGKSGTRLLWPDFLSDNLIYIFVVTKGLRPLLFFDLQKKEIAWKKEGLMRRTKLRKHSRELLVIEHSKSKMIKKITVFDVSKGDGT